MARRLPKSGGTIVACKGLIVFDAAGKLSVTEQQIRIVQDNLLDDFQLIWGLNFYAKTIGTKLSFDHSADFDGFANELLQLRDR